MQFLLKSDRPECKWNFIQPVDLRRYVCSFVIEFDWFWDIFTITLKWSIQENYSRESLAIIILTQRMLNWVTYISCEVFGLYKWSTLSLFSSGKSRERSVYFFFKKPFELWHRPNENISLIYAISLVSSLTLKYHLSGNNIPFFKQIYLKQSIWKWKYIGFFVLFVCLFGVFFSCHSRTMYLKVSIIVTTASWFLQGFSKPTLFMLHFLMWNKNQLDRKIT